MRFFRDILNPWRIFYWVILLVIVILLGFLVYLFTGQVEPADRINFGVTFSQKFAQEMGLDWREAYLAVLDDLKVDKLRLVAYWDILEPESGQYSFNDLDWQINEASQRSIQIILLENLLLRPFLQRLLPAFIQ